MTPPDYPQLPGAGRRAAQGVPDADSAAMALRIRRLRDTAFRVKWLLAACIGVGAAAGIGATRFVQPGYEVRGTVYLSSESRSVGPIREGQVLADQSWVDLLKSFRVLDSVVTRLRLHVQPLKAEDRGLLTGLSTAPAPRVGVFRLVVSPDGRSYVLWQAEDSIVGRGTLPDSVGHALGIRWFVEPFPPGGREIGFSVVRPRDVAVALRGRLNTFLPERGQILTAILSGSNGAQTAATLNAVLDEFVSVAGDLRRAQVAELASTLRGQLDLAEGRLRTAEGSLEAFRSANITRPRESEDGVVNDPLAQDYFNKRVQLDATRRDRETLQRILSDRATSIEALLAVPSVSQQPGPLRTALEELATKDAQLRAARQVYSEEYAIVRDLSAQVSTLRTETIPRLLQSQLATMRASEDELGRAVTGYASELQNVPQRAIEETRLRREFTIADQFYTSLLSRWNEVRLSAESTRPDVRVLDRPEAPSFPSSNTKVRVAALGLAAGIALAALLVFVIDLRDTRVRYPEEIERELGLDIMGFVPRMPRETTRDRDALAAAQAVEAFRTIRLRIQHDAGDEGPPLVVFTSSAANDGKSLVSANVATSFADAGIRTLLVDGDMRRGTQHATFGVAQQPGFTDVLTNGADLKACIVPTGTPGLDLLPCGRRHRRVPELLDRRRLEAIFAEIRREYGAIIVDSAPLAAGVDAYSLGVAAGGVVVVVRYALTDRRQLSARLDAADRLPIRFLGAVLNDIPERGMIAESYSYYSYLPEYALIDSDAPQAVLPGPRKE